MCNIPYIYYFINHSRTLYVNSQVRTFFAMYPDVPELALAETASRTDMQFIRWTLWVQRSVRALLPIQTGRISHAKKLIDVDVIQSILIPIARNLLQEKMSYPLTIVCILLRLCSFAFKIF